MRKLLIGMMFLALAASAQSGTSQFYGGELKQSTAVTIPVGPFEDDAGDGVLVTVTPADMNATFVYSNGTQVENTDLSAATNLLTVINGTDPDAWATVLITAANTANLGPLIMTLWDDGANIIEPITYRFEVVTADYYNTRYTAATISTTAQIATAVWQDTTDADFTTANSIGQNLKATDGAVPGAASGLAIVGSEMTADITKIHGSALTETAGQLAGAFTKFFDVATPTGTVNSIPDAVAGASGGLLISTSKELWGGPNYTNASTEEDGAVAGTSLSTTQIIYLTATSANNDKQYEPGRIVAFVDANGIYHFGEIDYYDSTNDVIYLKYAVPVAPANLTPIYSLSKQGGTGSVPIPPPAGGTKVANGTVQALVGEFTGVSYVMLDPATANATAGYYNQMTIKVTYVGGTYNGTSYEGTIFDYTGNDGSPFAYRVATFTPFPETPTTGDLYEIYSNDPAGTGSDFGPNAGNAVMEKKTTSTISAIDDNGANLVTVTTSAPHGLANADVVTISGTTNYNDASVAVTVVDYDTFTYTDADGVEAAEATGTVTVANSASTTSTIYLTANTNDAIYAAGYVIRYATSAGLYIDTTITSNTLDVLTVATASAAPADGTPIYSLGNNYSHMIGTVPSGAMTDASTADSFWYEFMKMNPRDWQEDSTSDSLIFMWAYPEFASVLAGFDAAEDTDQESISNVSTTTTVYFFPDPTGDGDKWTVGKEILVETTVGTMTDYSKATILGSYYNSADGLQTLNITPLGAAPKDQGTILLGGTSRSWAQMLDQKAVGSVTEDNDGSARASTTSVVYFTGTFDSSLIQEGTVLKWIGTGPKFVYGVVKTFDSTNSIAYLYSPALEAPGNGETIYVVDRYPTRYTKELNASTPN